MSAWRVRKYDDGTGYTCKVQVIRQGTAYRISIKPTYTDRMYVRGSFDVPFEFLRERGIEVGSISWESDSKGLIHCHGNARLSSSDSVIKMVRADTLRLTGWSIYIDGVAGNIWKEYLSKCDVPPEVVEQREASRYFSQRNRFYLVNDPRTDLP